MLHHLRHVGSDVARALVVLALVFLSFSHAPINAAPQAGDVLTAAVDSSFCGDLQSDDGKAHAPCHACRIGGGADLPPPPCTPLPARIIATVAYSVLPVLQLPAEPLAPYAARGPPTA